MAQLGHSERHQRLRREELWTEEEELWHLFRLRNKSATSSHPPKLHFVWVRSLTCVSKNVDFWTTSANPTRGSCFCKQDYKYK